MPYIDKLRREILDLDLEGLSKKIESEGELNYAINKLALGYIIQKKMSYAVLSTVIGTLTLAAREIEVRLGQYEMNKRIANGDLPEFVELDGQFIRDADQWLRKRVARDRE